MSHAEQGKPGPNPVVVPSTPHVPELYVPRSRPITVAALLSLVIGIVGMITGSAMVVLNLMGGGNFPGYQPIIDFAMALGFTTALVIIVGSVMNLVGWYWLWGRLKAGGVLGAINGINDIIFAAGGGLWIVYYVLPSIGMDIYSMAWLIWVLIAIAIVGIVTLVLLALGWKSLKAY